MKMLQYNPDKCDIMYIGKDIPKHKRTEMYVDGWKMKEVKETNLGSNENENELEEEKFEGEQEMTETN